MKKLQTFLNGLLFENPTLVIFLGMCPALGTTNTVENATYMSLCVLFVLLLHQLNYLIHHLLIHIHYLL